MALTIRAADERDTEAIQAIYAPYVRETTISFEVEPPSVEEIQLRMAAILPRFPWLVCEQDRAILGYAYAGPHHQRAAYQWSVEVAIYVDRQRHRSGLGRALYGALLPLLKLQGFFNAYAGITLPNPASVGLHEAMGFRSMATYLNVGYKLGMWLDVGYWHKALQEELRDPEPVLAFPELQWRDEYREILKEAVRGLSAWLR